MTKLHGFLQNLRKSPILWGLLGAAGFYGLIHSGPLGTPIVKRYFTGHPVEYSETILFAIGLAVLLSRILAVAGQRWALPKSPPATDPRTVLPAQEQSRALLDRLNRLPVWQWDDYYIRRLRAAAEYVQQRGSAEGLNDELKYLGDLDATRLHNRYALFHVIIWAIPILGFLGTTIGITMALNGIDVKSLDESMMHVLTGLGLKFDTTTLGLAMSILLMFSYFFVHRAESSLLEEVDLLSARDLAGRFPQTAAAASGDPAAMRQMVATMVQATERLVQRQAELWQASMDAAAARWGRMAETGGDQFKKGMTEALAESLRTHAQHLAAAEQASAEQNRRHWDKVQKTQAENVQALTSLQAELTQQAGVLGRAIEASGEVARLQDVLNRNLAALAGAKHFEKTVEGLAATIHLLNARLSESPTDVATIQLEPARRKTKAA